MIPERKSARDLVVSAMLDAADLPEDVAALKAMLIAVQAREAAKGSAIAGKDDDLSPETSSKAWQIPFL